MSVSLLQNQFMYCMRFHAYIYLFFCNCSKHAYAHLSQYYQLVSVYMCVHGGLFIIITWGTYLQKPLSFFFLIKTLIHFFCMLAFRYIIHTCVQLYRGVEQSIRLQAPLGTYKKVISWKMQRVVWTYTVCMCFIYKNNYARHGCNRRI